MSTIENTGGERELDQRLCSYVYPEGHERAGQQCRGGRGGTGYCAGHARSMGLLKHPQDEPRAPASGHQSLLEAAAAASAAQEMAQLSLSRRAAEWLAKPSTQRRLERRWDQILDQGSDAELIRLVKELTDRAEGRAGEAQAEPELTVPPSIEALRALSPEERRALLMADHRAQQH